MSNEIPSNPRRALGSEPRKPANTDKSPEQVINEAPLQTISTQQVIQVEDNQKPWRVGTSMSEDELSVLTEKGSYNIPMELVLRLDYLVGKKKSRGLGRKTNKTALLIEALDEYTKRELKKLGHSV